MRDWLVLIFLFDHAHRCFKLLMRTGTQHSENKFGDAKVKGMIDSCTVVHMNGHLNSCVPHFIAEHIVNLNACYNRSEMRIHQYAEYQTSVLKELQEVI